MLRESLQLHLSGHLDEAAIGYRNLLAREPGNVEALNLLGVLHRQRGELDQAEHLLEDARSRAPQRGDVLLELAGVRFLRRDLAGARGLAEAAIRLDPNLFGAHNLLGQVALACGDATKAEECYRTALRVKDDDVQSLTGLGNVLLLRGEIASALKLMTHAVELAPNDAFSQYALGRAFHSNGNTAFAVRALENALRLRAELHSARHLLGQLLIEQGRPQDAEEQFAMLGEATGFRAVAFAGLGDAARGQGKLILAIERYRASLAEDAAQPLVTQALAWCLLQLGRDNEAFDVYTSYLARFPGDRLILGSLADAHLMRDHTEAAYDLWSKLLNRFPDDAFAAQRLALLCERRGEFAEALAYANRAASAFANDPELCFLHVRAALRECRDADALSWLEGIPRDALSAANMRAVAHYRGLIHDRADEMAAAVECWRASQHNLISAVHAQETLPAVLTERLAEPMPEPRTATPIFLVGLPGSQVERVAALLTQQPGVRLLRDRTLAPLRQDDFSAPEFGVYLGGLSPEDATARRARYDAEVVRLGTEPDRVLIDWLPRWDARFLPLIRNAFPGTTLIVVERDPRDELINWLAFGWLEGFPLSDPEAGAVWLTKAHRHLAAVDGSGLRVIHVDADALLADPQNHGDLLAAALHLDSLVPGLAQRSLGDLPLGLPAGRWKAYRDVLSTAFSALGMNASSVRR